MTRFQKACLQVKLRNVEALNLVAPSPLTANENGFLMSQAERFADFIEEIFKNWKTKRAERQKSADADKPSRKARDPDEEILNRRLEAFHAKERAEKIRVIRNQILTSYYAQTSTDWVESSLTRSSTHSATMRDVVTKAHKLAEDIYDWGINVEKSMNKS